MEEAAVNSIRAFGSSKGYLLDVREGNIVCVEKESLFVRIWKRVVGEALQQKPSLTGVAQSFVALARTPNLASAFRLTSDRRGLETLYQCGARLQQLQDKNPGQIAELNNAITALNDLIRAVNPDATQYQTREIAPPPAQIEEEEEEEGLPDGPVEGPLETESEMDVEDPAVKAHREEMLRYQIGDRRCLPLLDLHVLHEKSYPSPYLFQEAFASIVRKPLHEINLRQMSRNEIKRVEETLESDLFIVWFSEKLVDRIKDNQISPDEKNILIRSVIAMRETIIRNKSSGLPSDKKGEFLAAIKGKFTPKEFINCFDQCEFQWALREKDLLGGVWRDSGLDCSAKEFREAFIVAAHQVLSPKDKNRYKLDPRFISERNMDKILALIEKKMN